jgi:hypothetical protein
MNTRITLLTMSASVIVMVLAAYLAGCPPRTYPDNYIGDDDDASDDDSAGDDDVVDDDMADDDTVADPCQMICTSPLGDCVDWGTLGGTCETVCPSLSQQVVNCIAACDPPPPPEDCDCATACLD